MKYLIAYLLKHCKLFNIKEDAISGIEDLKVQGDNFIETASKYLAETHEKVNNHFRNNENDTWKENIYKDIMETLWGCDENCPLCKEPCQFGKKHASNHMCSQHRPSGLIGIRYHTVLCMESCDYFDRTHICSICKTPDCSSSHEYREYKQVISDWEMEPNSDKVSSIYWHWFMATYKDQLAKYHDVQSPDIPSEWSMITKENAINSLRETY